jgi:soluble lytic murein transglycosylase-like protein
MTMGRERGPAIFAAAALLGAAASTSGRAAVIDIAPDGRVTVSDGPRVQLSTDPAAARPILVEPVVRPRASAALRADGQVADAIRLAAQTQQLDGALIEAVAWQESRFRPGAVSPKGAVGVMQLMPATARAVGAQGGDVYANVRGGTTYLRRLLAYYQGDLPKALAAYNAGPGAVDRYGGAPPYKETRAYVSAVLEHLAQRVAPTEQTPDTRQFP